MPATVIRALLVLIVTTVLIDPAPASSFAPMRITTLSGESPLCRRDPATKVQWMAWLYTPLERCPGWVGRRLA